MQRELVEAIAAAADGEDVSGRRGIVAVDWRQLSALAERGREALKEGEGTTRKSSSFLPSFREVIMTLTDTKFVLDTPSAEGTLYVNERGLIVLMVKLVQTRCSHGKKKRKRSEE